MPNPIATLSDDFTNSIIDPTWTTAILGSATVAETGGQAVIALPSSTAGLHSGAYRSVQNYDLTGDDFSITIGTMVATGVAATAYYELVKDYGATPNAFQWIQLSNSITAVKVIAGVSTTLFTATWSASTYKYLRIRESGGTTFWDSSTNGTSWTNRASVANPFAVTSMTVEFGASCGNVASPGSFRLDDVNLIAGLATNWRWLQCERPETDYVRTVTLAYSSGQGYIATADSVDASGNLSNVRYYSGPLGSASGGYNQLTLASSQANAQSNAVALPNSALGLGRWDLPTTVQCRIVRLYFRSTTGSSVQMAEMYPRRLVQSDDIQAESLTAINIAADAITADKINVLQLSALTADAGTLTAGTLTGTTIRSAASGARWEGNSTHLFGTDGTTTQWEVLNSTGKFTAGAGAVTLDSTGIKISAPTAPVLTNAYGFTAGGVASGALYPWNTSGLNAMLLKVLALSGQDSTLQIQSDAPTGQVGKLELISSYVGGNLAHVTMQSNGAGAVIAVSAPGGTTFNDGVNVGSGTGASTGEVVASGVASAFGGIRDGNIALRVQGSTTTSARYGLIVYNSTPTIELSIRNDGVGFLNAAAWTYSSDKRLKENITPLDAGLDTILALKPTRFDYIDGAKNQLGFIAQDVQNILPELVSEQEDGMLSMQTTSLIPVLVNAIKDLQGQIYDLRSGRK